MGPEKGEPKGKGSATEAALPAPEKDERRRTSLVWLPPDAPPAAAPAGPAHRDPLAEGAGAAAAGPAELPIPQWDAAWILDKYKKSAVIDIQQFELERQDVQQLRDDLFRIRKWSRDERGRPLGGWPELRQLSPDFHHVVRKACKSRYWKELSHADAGRRASRFSCASDIPHDEGGGSQPDVQQDPSPTSWGRSSSPSPERGTRRSPASPQPLDKAGSPSGSPDSRGRLVKTARSASPEDGGQGGGSQADAAPAEDSAAGRHAWATPPLFAPVGGLGGAAGELAARAAPGMQEAGCAAAADTLRSEGSAFAPDRTPSAGHRSGGSGRATVHGLPQGGGSGPTAGGSLLTLSRTTAASRQSVGTLQISELTLQGESAPAVCASAGSQFEGLEMSPRAPASPAPAAGSPPWAAPAVTSPSSAVPAGSPAFEDRARQVAEVAGVAAPAEVAIARATAAAAAGKAAAAAALATVTAAAGTGKYAELYLNVYKALKAVDEGRLSTPNDSGENNDSARYKLALSGCGYMLLPVFIVFLLFCLAGVLGIAISDQEVTNLPSTVTIRGGSVYVNGAPFVVKGVAYSPVWKGQDGMSKWPYGDHMFKPRVSHLQIPQTFHGLTQGNTDFDRFDRFHLAKIKAAGFNTVRLYNWLLDKDHTAFLNSCHDYGLMVIVTFWMDAHTYNPLADTDQRHKAKVNFEHLLRRYKDHPAVLMWALGNEPNLPGVPQSYYSQMPDFISLCGELREVRDRVEQTAAEPHPIIIPLAVTGDVNTLLKKYDMSTSFDLWGIQPYMSPSDLNTFLLNLDVETKPVLITEYGADSLYDDRQRRYSAFKRQVELAVDEHAQVGQFINLTKIMFKFLAGKPLFGVCMPQQKDCDPDRTVSVHALPWPETVYDAVPVNEGRRNPETGYQEISFRDNGNPRQHLDKVVDDWTNANSNLQHMRYNRLAGLVVFEWMDEWWKGLKHDPDHSDCQQDNGYRQSSCGYFNVGFGRDWRVNEEYFGMAAQDDAGSTEDKVCLRPKPMFYTSQVIFGNATNLSGVQPFCSECARSSSANSVDATYLTRLRVVAAPEDGRSDVRIAYGTRLIAKDTANATTWSFGEVFDAARDTPRGVVTITDNAPRLMRINWRLSGLPYQCNGDRNPPSANACAVRIHEAYNCSSDELRGHFFRREPDPWQHPWSVNYTAQAGAWSTGAAMLDFGFRIPNAMGRAVVVYDHLGDPAACGVLNSATGWAPAQAGVFELTSFPGHSIVGSLNLTDVNEKPIGYHATFRGAHINQTLTLKVLSGTDCLSAHSMGAPLFFDREQPWSSAVPNVSSDRANSTLALHFDNGYALADLFGQVVAVFSGADVVACAVMRRRSELEGFAVFGNVRPGGPWLTGDVDFTDQTQRELRFEWNMTSIAPGCPESPLIHALACTISLRTVVGRDANGRDVAEWWDSGVKYRSDASGTSSGNMTVTDYAKALGDLDGVSVDFRDENAQVSARGDIVVDMDKVTVRYDGYEEGAECACCVSSPLRQLVDLPLHYVLFALGAGLGVSLLFVCGFRVYAWKENVRNGTEKSTPDAGVGSGEPRGHGESPPATACAAAPSPPAAAGPDSAALPEEGQEELCSPATLSMSQVPSRFDSYRDAAPGRAALPLDECEFHEVQKYLQKYTGVSHVLAVMRLAFRNPPTMKDLKKRREREAGPERDAGPARAYDLQPAFLALVATISNVAHRQAAGSAPTLGTACRQVYEDTVPAECRYLSPSIEMVLQNAMKPGEVPPGPDGRHCFWHYAMLALLYLAVQQRVEGLRQCRWFKAVAYNHIRDRVLTPGDHEPCGDHKQWARAMQEVTVVVLHHLELVEQDVVNYADIDDMYNSLYQNQTEQTRTNWTDRLLSSTRGYGGKGFKSFEDVVSVAKQRTRLEKRFPEKVSWFLPLRLFSFTVHTHTVLFYAAVALNVRLRLDTTWWLLGAVEALFCILNFAVDVWLFPWPRFGIRVSYLTVVNVLVSAAYILLHLQPASQGGSELGFWQLYVVWMWVSEAIVRPLWTLHTRRDAHPEPWRVLWGRWLTLFFMFVFQVFFALFFIAPGISAIGISLCRCPVDIIQWLVEFGWLQGKANACTTDIRDYLCFSGVFAFVITTFLSLTLMAHVSYMLLSIACGYIVGLQKGLGSAKTWRQALALLPKDKKSGELGIYGTLQPAEEHWLYASMFRHMWERDLISSEHCKAYCDPSCRATAPPPPEEALVQILQFLNGHHGLKSEFESTPESESEEYRKALRKCVRVSRMPSLSVMVPYYTETVLFSMKDLRQGLLRHMSCLWPEEWRIFCERTFFGYSNAQRLLEAFEAGDDALRMWMDCRDRWEDDCFKCAESLAQRKKWGAYHWRYDPPPPSLVDDPDLARVVLEDQTEDNMAARQMSSAPGNRYMSSAPEDFLHFPSHGSRICIDPRILPVVTETYRQCFPEEEDVLKSPGLAGSPLRPRRGHGPQLQTGPLPQLLATQSGCVLASAQRRGRGGVPIGQLVEPLNGVWRKWLREHAGSERAASLLTKHRLNVQYWLELQVRLWASLRGQTLARLAYGLHEMREAVCDLAYFELRSLQEQRGAGEEIAESPVSLTERSTVLDVCAWVHQGAGEPDRRWDCAVARGLGIEEQHVSARVADLITFACRYWRVDGEALFNAVAPGSVDLHKSLNDPHFRETAAKWCMPMFLVDGLDADAFENADYFVEQVCTQLPDLIAKAVTRAKVDAQYREDAEKLVSRKVQFCFGAQMYWANPAVRQPTDELLRMDRLRHIELVTDKELGKKAGGWGTGRVDFAEFNTIHVRRRHAATNRTNFLRQFGPPEWWLIEPGRGAGDKHHVSTYMSKEEENEFEFTVFHRLCKLALAEPKAENQNNIITCARGEVLQMLDMNQDAYYAEGIKLPLVLQLWDKSFSGSSEKGRNHILHLAGQGCRVSPKNASARQEASKYYHLLGFREHIFTESHSAVGRYMALAEFSFVTLIQRFLANPHEVRLHYGHPDMVKAAHMKQTGGVSRSSKGVNVNEDIFLGYEMAATGRDTAMIEYISYGKGREVDFNNASVFLKKLSAGAVMQLGSRQVYKLYTEELWTPQKWALFYGSLAHFINIYLTDFTIFLFTYVLMIFALADLTPQNFRLLESPLADPWLIQVGMFYILPMVVERNLERSYLHASDFVMSIPFFAHQNRITASYFGSTMHMSQGKYMGTDRGMGNKRTSMVAAYLQHTATNFIPGLRLLLCAAVYYWAGYGCADCRTTDSDMFRLWIVLISACSYLMAPALYNPKPTFSAVWREWADSLAWIAEDAGELRFVRYHSANQCLGRSLAQCERWLPPGANGEARKEFHLPKKRIERWMGRAKAEGQERSMRVLWVFEWLEYLNAKGLNAAGHGCERVQGATSVFVRELVMILSKYGLWVTVPVVAFSMSRGEATTETAPDGTTIKVEPPRMLEFSWVLFTFIVLDVSIYIMGECFAFITKRISTASCAEGVPRIIRLAALPVMYICLIALIFLGSDHPLDEALAEFLFYNIFAGISFATITELTLAVIQFRINTQHDGIRETITPPTSQSSSPRAASGKDPGPREHWPAWRKNFDEESSKAKLRENYRLDVLLWMSRWNPLILYYQRMYLLVSLCLVVPNAVLAAIARLHTTWLFTEHVARSDAGKD